MARNSYGISKDTCIFVNILDDFVLTLKMFPHVVQIKFCDENSNFLNGSFNEG